MAKITLFEFNPEGNIQIGPSGEGEEGLLSIATGEDAELDEDIEEDDESGGGLAKVIVPLVALIAIAAAVRYVSGGEDEEELGEESGGRLDQFKTTTE
ncbi:hypothetical protein [Natronoarchaeum rubrum]|uniref:hypothetical protein n=1 Tax=Natronoarchaeum rubrum TaxID=755311 RepID=UPI0021119B83|nr:hypothetical protein [Natronoarchaeum rubrum]HMB50563.1 hypothetical protein [Natronoarchaeum rubrum]